tara:strand:+ start:12180 stop:12863 length:684 start_codon:yes stop_codon:yes gene_type:complete
MSSVKLSPEAADQQSKLATQKALFELGKQTANKEQSINERVKRELKFRQKINNIKSDLNEHPNTRFSKEITDKIDPFEKLIKIQEDNIDSLMKQLSQLHEENNEREEQAKEDAKEEDEREEDYLKQIKQKDERILKLREKCKYKNKSLDILIKFILPLTNLFVWYVTLYGIDSFVNDIIVGSVFITNKITNVSIILINCIQIIMMELISCVILLVNCMVAYFNSISN